ncbi:dynein axonemal heavy chain 1 [Periophthalmus magnuspinnatus]|uniref:dynein axonemal heavy chain 1 n=1 Tax=Periophthalmus magnuspinnatus TaxID=409849 RepID=UPI0024365783|nr:dynein axonemal heavy chain 1 [Periophthalmus magnuspinnatus]
MRLGLYVREGSESKKFIDKSMPQQPQTSYFCNGGDLPKVQLPYETVPGKIPRKLEIERRRREYSQLKIEHLLEENGIDSNNLMPKCQESSNDCVSSVSPYLPLEIFDNVEFDCRTPEDWLSLGVTEGSSDRKPIPAKALLPTEVSFDSGALTQEYNWQLVGVLDYNKETSLYLVEKVHLKDLSGNSILSQQQEKTLLTGEKPYITEGRYWVPRIRVLFKAEDPRIFVQRIKNAKDLRDNTEALLLYNLCVDCMPICEGTSLDSCSLQRIKKYALTTPGLRLNSLGDCVKRLEEQIQLDYSRTMNRMTFDYVVKNQSVQVLSHIIIPKKEQPLVLKRGPIPAPAFSYKETSAKIVFCSLLTQPKVLFVLSKIWCECDKVANMQLFHITMTKPLWLKDFETLQSQMHTQVNLYLRETWISTVTKVIRSALLKIGRGTYDVNESSWKMYEITKLRKLMNVVRYKMQDALRYLVQNSLTSLTQRIMDACYSTLTCSEDLVWGEDLITSPYKSKKNTLFLVDLVLDQTGVHYNTPLENFPSSLVKLFDKGIVTAENIPHVERFVMENIFFGGDILLESVNLWEPEVIEQRKKIHVALSQASIPLRAYAAEYMKYLELHNQDIETLLKSSTQTEMTSQVVKKEVEQHLKEKERLEQTLPLFINIGPFTVQVETVRHALCNKRKALAKSLQDQFAQRLRKQIDNACDECIMINRKLCEKQKSVEELSEMTEWMKQIPEQLRVYNERLKKTLAEYDVLEDFLYLLPDDDFNKKWAAIGWPQKIFRQIEKTIAQHKEDKEHFQKIQQSEQNSFEEEITSLQMLVAGFGGFADMDHAHELANKVKRIKKQLKDCQAMAQTYNNRERLLGLPLTNYDRLHNLVVEFQPYEDLWTTTSNWLRWHESWLNDPLTSVDSEQLERSVTEAYKIMHKCVKLFKDNPGCHMVAALIRSRIEEFRPYIPLIQGLNNPGMRSRHWEMLSERIHMKVQFQAKLTFSRCLELGLQNFGDQIAQVAEVAGKEYAIERALDKMKDEWSTLVIDVLPYKNTGTYILKSPDEASQLLDDHIVMTQSMAFSPFKKSFESRIINWESKLKMTQDVLEEWLTCQRSLLYLEPIFSSPDINQQLPAEAQRYHQMEKMWTIVMKKANNNRKIIELCPDARLLSTLKMSNSLLEEVQKGLIEYLETKRRSFPRFYFLSDDELLEILSQTKDPTAVQPHLRKCFENIARLKFQPDLQMTDMYSGEGEEVKLFQSVRPSGDVEDWLKNVEKSMKATVKDNIDRSLKVYCEQPREKWVLSWPGQVVIAGCQVFWTAEVSEAIEKGDLANRLYPQLQTQLSNLVQLVRGDLSRMQRAVLSALIVIEVHAKDVAAELVQQKVSNINDFEWISQLRYYWARDDLYVRVVNAEFLYGYEYLGNSGRLVITPLTDRCYLTLTGALHLKFGGAPAGPAGTGKTETTKDLGKALAIQTVVFNCSDQLDFKAMGKFFKGLASSGAWACFDEFNRIDVEVLSVVAQQITTIQKAQQQRVERFEFEGTEITLVPSCAVFITMNPGYAGRTELPDNLKALFRPVAMMVPNYAMIAEISLYSFGFNDAKILSKKITSTFKLSSEQLSSQDHYDFGMRAVKTVISAAGNLKREHPEMNEELICLRAINDVNVPKFLQDDLKLFNGIVSDLFPKTKQEPINYGTLEQSMRSVCTEKNLKDVDGFIHKCIQLYETTVVRHGLMLVGPSGSGKTRCYEVLAAAITALKGQPSVSGGEYEAVKTYVLNPKSITMGQLYGEYDLLTQEWTDGILSALVRGGASSMDQERKWYMFDGPVDAVWIENMNTVLDDNKKLCLSSGEIIKLTDVMTMMFEVQDLAVASPATVSRCGMVYLEPSILGLTPFTESWLKQIPDALKPYSDQLTSLFSRFLKDSVRFVRGHVKEVIRSLDSNLTCSLLKLMDCFFDPFNPKEKERLPPQHKVERLKEVIEPWFFFSLVWSVGATGNATSCQHFSNWLREKMANEKIELCFPAAGLVYDYKLNDGGISNFEDDDDDPNKSKVQWISWMKHAPDVVITAETNYADIIVPTPDTVRMTFLLDMLLNNKKPVLCIGPTGTGKTLTMSDKLLKNMSADFITHFLMFSARTSANQTQDYIDNKLDKRRKNVFGPPKGKYFIFFIDDLNMPMLETYGAQPPIELLRQWMDHGGWYDRKQIGNFRHLVDINFACAMGPPGGGRNPITPRFSRHFNFLSFTEMDDVSKKHIFTTILGSWMAPAIQSLNEALVEATIRVYSTITSQLLPTPAKSHYTFNLRDLSKVFQGMLMANANTVEEKSQLLQLWYHESCRVFQDRLVCVEDREWFSTLLKDCVQDFSCKVEDILTCEPVLFGDFMVLGADPKIYTLIDDKDEVCI